MHLNRSLQWLCESCCVTAKAIFVDIKCAHFLLASLDLAVKQDDIML